uniref:EGF-like domain-containing protein n=1 Tax=Glossina palpalis gambiensis TaxID=67801 RepID=A0A1B0B1F7_9MUSC
MKAITNFLQVVIVLSTIVAVTDCCSSRILLLKEQTLKAIEQQKIQQQQSSQQPDENDRTEEVFEFQPQIEKYLQHVKDFINSIAINPNKTHAKETTNSTDRQSILKDNMMSSSSIASLSSALQAKGLTATNVLQNPTPSDNLNDNPNYNFLQLYTFMSDVLSAPCTGEYSTDYCLNKGHCFVHLVGLFYCKCADGYVGERCESKYVYLDGGGGGKIGEYVAPSSLSKQKPKILTARVVFSFPMLIILTIIYVSIGMSVIFKCQPIYKFTRQSWRLQQKANHLLYE